MLPLLYVDLFIYLFITRRSISLNHINLFKIKIAPPLFPQSNGITFSIVIQTNM